MIRITSAEHGSETIVSIAGRLDVEHLAQVEAHCRMAEKEVVLDLSELQNADDEAFGWLRGHVERGVRVTGASPYVRLKLELVPENSTGWRTDEIDKRETLASLILWANQRAGDRRAQTARREKAPL